MKMYEVKASASKKVNKLSFRNFLVPLYGLFRCLVSYVTVTSLAIVPILLFCSLLVL